MTTVSRCALAAAGLLACFAAAAGAQQQPPSQQQAAPALSAGRDCSRWPNSAYDEPSGSCICPSGMWWNLRGDACLPREHAAGEFCTTVWPGSEPYFVGAGGYRCVCAPPLIWDANATACRMPMATGAEADCQREWPGTLPVLSPSGTESECRCPGGKRWDEGSRSCVLGAPVVASRAFFNEGYGAPVGTPPGGQDGGVAAPGAAGRDVAPNALDGAAPLPPAPAGGGVQGIPPPPRASGTNANCDALLAEIRARAQAGQSDQADALGMRAAVAGCDPGAISQASRAPAGQ